MYVCICTLSIIMIHINANLGNGIIPQHNIKANVYYSVMILQVDSILVCANASTHYTLFYFTTMVYHKDNNNKQHKQDLNILFSWTKVSTKHAFVGLNERYDNLCL